MDSGSFMPLFHAQRVRRRGTACDATPSCRGQIMRAVREKHNREAHGSTQDYLEPHALRQNPGKDGLRACLPSRVETPLPQMELDASAMTYCPAGLWSSLCRCSTCCMLASVGLVSGRNNSRRCPLSRSSSAISARLRGLGVQLSDATCRATALLRARDALQETSPLTCNPW